MAQLAQLIAPEDFQGIGIPEADAKAYAESFTKEGITKDNVQLLDKELLHDLGIQKLGHKLSILKLCHNTESTNITSNIAKISPAKAPELLAEMTKTQFRKYRIDWNVFCEITSLPVDKHHATLYNSAAEDAQIAIINSFPDFFNIPVKDLLNKIETVVTQKSNPMIHRVKFSKLAQSANESIQSYVIRLRSAAKECDFLCPQCRADISSTYIKDQLISGVHNHILQMDILSKAETLLDVNSTIKHCESFEAALRDQNNLNPNVNHEEIAMAKLSSYRRSKGGTKPQNASNLRSRRESDFNASNLRSRRESDFNASNQRSQNSRIQRRGQSPCTGCAKYHTKPYRRSDVCPAWGKPCDSCGVMNHFASACRRGRGGSAYNVEAEEFDSDIIHGDAEMSALIAHINFDPAGKIVNEFNFEKDIIEIDALVRPFQPQGIQFSFNKQYQNKTIKVFPDSGASICLGGLKHLSLLGFKENNLIKCNKIVTAVGKHQMICLGWLPIEFLVNGRATKQALYICDRVERLYFSKKACIDVGILPKSFPFPNTEYPIANTYQIQDSPDPASSMVPVSSPIEVPLPTRPSKIPYPPTTDNIPKLKQWLLDSFKNTAFNKTNKCGEFPALSGPPAHIHLKEGFKPRARHSPIPVPFHMKDAVKKSLDDDVKRGIIKPVQIGTPTEWCSTMVVMPKKMVGLEGPSTISTSMINVYVKRIIKGHHFI